MALNLINQLRRVVTSRRLKEEVAAQVIADMKESIAAGVSPVRGERRFVAYKNPEKYPGDRKSKRPVNLYLSGDMLAALRFYPTAGPSVSIGIKGQAGVIARAHNDGTSTIPRRHFMPTDKGDEFSVTITRRIRDLYARAISDILSR